MVTCVHLFGPNTDKSTLSPSFLEFSVNLWLILYMVGIRNYFDYPISVKLFDYNGQSHLKPLTHRVILEYFA